MGRAAAPPAGSITGRIDFLQKVPLLKSLTDYQIGQLADALQVVKYHDGEDIIVQGQEGSKFYIIEEGNVKVRQTTAKGLVDVAELTQGNFFGERALIKNEPRDASCTANGGEVTCLVLDREHFNQLLGPLESILENVSNKRDKKNEAAFNNLDEAKKGAGAPRGRPMNKIISGTHTRCPGPRDAAACGV